MTSEEFKQWRLNQKGRKRMGKTHQGWSQSETAEFLGLSKRTVQSWESGGRPVPKRITKLIEEISNG